MEYAECQTCHPDLSIFSSMLLAYTSKLLSIINVDFNVAGYLLIRYSQYVRCCIKEEWVWTLCLLSH